jgi:hypothetical protein
MANLTLRSVKGSALTHSELDGNFEYFTGSIDAINAGTGSFLTSADTASFITSADTASFITSEDTGSFVTSAQTASLNISDTKYTVSTALSASGTTQSTTSICIYGVNVFEYVTTTHQATKLPQPVTGKSVRIVNNSNAILRVFPSNIGGHINNYPIDTPALIPPDGNLYEFICVENPLPGAWTFSAPATAQYDSGEMELSITALSRDGYNPWVTGWDTDHVGIISGLPTGDFRIDFKNFPPLVYRTEGGYTHTGYSPSTPWKGISKIKVYTNLIGTQSLNTYFMLKGIGTEQLYTLNDPLQHLSLKSMVSDSLYEMQLGKRISGTAVTGSTAYTSVNIGDAGTVWDEISFGTTFNTDGAVSDYGTLVGYKTLDSAYPIGFDDSYVDANGDTIDVLEGTPVELAYGSTISFYIRPFLSDFNYGTIPDFKFRFIIEYFQ